MAFKTAKDYNEERYGGMFLLRNDGDYADVIFMYQSESDVLVADTHYLKSADYNGYAHCCGKGCPACSKGIRVQTKLFIPMYNITEGQIQFWDRTMRFEPQLHKDVFSKYPNPADFVFRITRHGAAGDVNTSYEIMAIGKNTFKSYESILADNHVTSPEYYSMICREISANAMRDMIANHESTDSSSSIPDYTPSPRVVITPTNESSFEAPVAESPIDDDDIGDEPTF